MATRLENNHKILKLIEKLIERYPDQRFGQIIANYVLRDYRKRDIFFEESSETLKNMQEWLG